MKSGLFHRAKLLVGVKRTLGASFTIRLVNPKFRNVTTSQSGKKIQEVDPRSTLAGGDIAKSENGHDDLETSTQGALGPTAQLCSIVDPTFHCRIFSYGQLYVFTML
ncbi:predicted protein [Lichtheimia corymbifera JMRC:FSU:9682]|uniref:Uncharacterized protein n=1 Tax=Lichtheimia corymbifera JMRC:FSU:9682 TaxID=1263082 RepID=A0A068S976_9FUNG|nr:predicted protein [Lichtheimia corymbifera JMRC:FSU:9682]